MSLSRPSCNPAVDCPGVCPPGGWGLYRAHTHTPSLHLTSSFLLLTSLSFPFPPPPPPPPSLFFSLLRLFSRVLFISDGAEPSRAAPAALRGSELWLRTSREELLFFVLPSGRCLLRGGMAEQIWKAFRSVRMRATVMVSEDTVRVFVPYGDIKPDPTLHYGDTQCKGTFPSQDFFIWG